MADFSHLEALDVTKDKVVDYPLHQITVDGHTPTLLVAPATDANKPYFNVLLKKSNKHSRAVRAGAMNSGIIAETRDEDRELYPRFVVKGWRDVSDAKGKEVIFSRDECSSFLSALPDWVFDDLRQFCTNPANYTEVLDVEIQAKN